MTDPPACEAVSPQGGSSRQAYERRWPTTIPAARQKDKAAVARVVRYPAAKPWLRKAKTIFTGCSKQNNATPTLRHRFPVFSLFCSTNVHTKNSKCSGLATRWPSRVCTLQEACVWFLYRKGSGAFLAKVGLKKNCKRFESSSVPLSTNMHQDKRHTSKLVFSQNSRMCQHRQQKHSHEAGGTQ